MLILAVLCALAAGWCTGGRLSRFEGAGLRLLPLPVAALLLQRFFLRPWTLLLSYGLLLVFLVCNRHLKKTVPGRGQLVQSDGHCGQRMADAGGRLGGGADER